MQAIFKFVQIVVLPLAVGLGSMIGGASHAAESPDELKSEARTHFDAGVTMLKAEDFEGAAGEFERAVDLYPAISSMFNLASAYRAVHRYADALQTLHRLMLAFGDKMPRAARDESIKLKKELDKIVARVLFDVNVDGAEISIEGKVRGKSPLERAIFLNPGMYAVKISRAGYLPDALQIEVAASEETTYSIVLKMDEYNPQGAMASGDVRDHLEANGPMELTADVKSNRTNPRVVVFASSLIFTGASLGALPVVTSIRNQKTREYNSKPSEQQTAADGKTIDRLTWATRVLAGAVAAGALTAAIMSFFLNSGETPKRTADGASEPSGPQKKDNIDFTAQISPFGIGLSASF